jgi:hypothetical protein
MRDSVLFFSFYLLKKKKTQQEFYFIFLLDTGHNTLLNATDSIKQPVSSSVHIYLSYQDLSFQVS